VSEPQEQDGLGGAEWRGAERIPPGPVTTKQISKAAELIHTTLQEIALSVRSLQEFIKNDDLPGSMLLLQDRSGRLETNIETLQQTMNLVVDRVSDPRTREKEFLGSLLNALLDVGDTVSTVKEVLTGLTKQVQIDREACSCAWREYLSTQVTKEEDIFFNLARIAHLAPELDTFIRDSMSKNGYNPDTGLKREWFLVQVDKVRSAFDNMLINLVAGCLLGVGLYVYHYISERSQVLKVQAEFETERSQHRKQLEILVKSNQSLAAQLSAQNKGRGSHIAVPRPSPEPDNP
jgi:hypothetical protein